MLPYLSLPGSPNASRSAARARSKALIGSRSVPPQRRQRVVRVDSLVLPLLP